MSSLVACYFAQPAYPPVLEVRDGIVSAGLEDDFFALKGEHPEFIVEMVSDPGYPDPEGKGTSVAHNEQYRTFLPLFDFHLSLIGFENLLYVMPILKGFQLIGFSVGFPVGPLIGLAFFRNDLCITDAGFMLPARYYRGVKPALSCWFFLFQDLWPGLLLLFFELEPALNRFGCSKIIPAKGTIATFAVSIAFGALHV